MKFLTLLSLLIIVSCGKNTETILIENKYDDSKIIAQSKLQDARIQSLEGRINEINQVLDSMLNFDDVQDMINDKYDDLDNYLSDLENRINNK